MPLGSNDPTHTDLRIIASTNKNMKEEVRNGNFREDLFFRLNIFPIQIAPLRERKEDIPLLVEHFVKQITLNSALGHKKFSKGAVKKLAEYNFPGNIRELKNIVERLLILEEGDTVIKEDVQHLLKGVEGEEKTSLFSQPYKNAKKNFEKLYVEKKLKENNWNISATAQILDIERTNLHRKMRELGIRQCKEEE